jgi:hypothetical protein
MSVLYRDPRRRQGPEPGGPPNHRRLALLVLAALAVIGLSAVPFLLGARQAHVLPDATFAAATDATVARDLDVSFGSYTITAADPAVTAGHLPVTITNTGRHPVSARVQVHAVTATGAALADDIALVTDLAPGHSVTQNLFTATSGRDSAALAYAHFSVAAVSAR